jgi:thioredoxin reductase (NADPH)
VRARTGAGEELIFATSSLFLFIGADPKTDWLRGCVALDRKGFVLTGPALPPDARATEQWRLAGRTPFLLETSVPGVFAAGDVQDHVYRQAITSAGTGCMAALDAQRFLEQAAL